MVEEILDASHQILDASHAADASIRVRINVLHTHERESERESEGERQRQRERQGGRKAESGKGRERESERDIHKQEERETQRECSTSYLGERKTENTSPILVYSGIVLRAAIIGSTSNLGGLRLMSEGMDLRGLFFAACSQHSATQAFLQCMHF